MIKGLGIDIVEIARMERNLANAHFMERVFTGAERAYIGEGNLAAERAAGNFAAKEAAAKAMGCGFAGCPFDCVEALRDEAGAPYLAFSGAAGRRMAGLGANRAWVSITHAGGVASAVVVLEGD